jgi:hypothetical protein
MNIHCAIINHNNLSFGFLVIQIPGKYKISETIGELIRYDLQAYGYDNAREGLCHPISLQKITYEPVKKK